MTTEGSHHESYERGIDMRKRVLGAEHVERSLASVSEFSRPIQELVTEYCWGEVWTRPGIEPRTRSMLNLAMLTALNRPHELAVHVRGAVHNGVTAAEIQEVLLQTAIYVGVPAALESFRIAERVLTELGQDAQDD
ncbi:4-carboxymuconolactone decarboxylase [Prauserella marina]|uniref:4-carboxymuconolactone decarboxylase n=1 Tax=Prauserella marina TaxID=530584 RepID=A0A222VSL1_9PSEU|nr:4-carboxymuconolactone decarboxylase [Prauserella marina]ASR36907.1 4-carboxymuconolactone decarboxylase [Prauserella marina]PWV80151.1 4-carboxymuconolactone decarboxylase [Prauserella marina]SDD48288.1 4-carboxymuconolactone decarboxylase [Prauserella marina]